MNGSVVLDFFIENRDEIFGFLQMAYSIISALGNICLIFIGVYTFYRTFISKKFVINSLGFSDSTWDGFSVILSIQNKTLSAISIKKILLVVNENYQVEIKKYEEPLVLDPLKAVRVESDKYPRSPFHKSYIYDEKLKFLVYCSNGKILKIPYKPRKKLLKKDPSYKYERRPMVLSYYNNVLVVEGMKYAVHIVDSDNSKFDTFINEMGMLRDAIGGYNAIPSESMESEASVIEALRRLVGSEYQIRIVELTKELK